MIGMLFIPYVYIAAVYTAIYLLVRAAVSIRNKKIDWKRERLHILMYINLLVIIYFTFSPLLLDLNEVFNCRINLIPFVYLLDYDVRAHMIYNVFGNIMMFVPTGIVLPVLYKRLDNFFKVAGTGLLISLAIEILQLPFADRTSDVDDLILNTLGVVIGYVLFVIVRFAKKPGKQKASLSEES
jgi:glycopeptide antibiotics resistance protein